MVFANSPEGSISQSPTPLAPVFGDDFYEVRAKWMLDENLAHLNHGAFGAVPIEVHRLQHELRDEVERDPTAWFGSLSERVANARMTVADFFHSEHQGLALVHNASAGASTVLSSFGLGEGDEVLVTNHGYGAVTYAVERACRAVGATVKIARFDRLATSDEILGAISASFTDSTRLVVVDHITSPTARRLPLEAIVQAAHDHAILVLVDAAHGPGMYEVDLSSLGADYWVGNLHKWCCAPRATAALYVAPERRASVAPLVVSWLEHQGFPRAFDMAGTMDLTAWLAAPRSLEVLKAIGWERLRRYNSELARYGQQVIAEALHVEHAQLVFDEGLHMAVVPLPDGVADTDEKAVALRQRVKAELHAEVTIICFEKKGLLRVSAQVYNQPSDYERLGVGLSALIGG